MTDSAALPPTGWTALLLRIAQQSWPVLIGQWAIMAHGLIDTVMTGHDSATALAATALASSVYITVFVGLQGIVHAMIPICAQHFGARRLHEIGETWGQGVWLALGLSVAGGAAMAFPDMWLSMSGNVEPVVRTQVSGYLLMLIAALPAALLFRTIYALNTAVLQPKVVMAINVASIGLKMLFNWVFIFGKLGMPALGAVGAGVSTALVSWISLALGAIVLWRTPYFRQFALRLGRPSARILGELLRLGLPMGAAYLIEVTSFTFMSLLVAREGVFAVGGHQIMTNTTAFCYMTPLALGISSGALTAHAIGAGNWAEARRTGIAGLLVGTACALVTITAITLWRGPIVAAYTSDAGVAAVALSLLTLLIPFHLFDTWQCIGNYLLRAYKISFLPMVIQAVSLWGIGLLAGWWLGFGPGSDTGHALVNALVPGAPPGAGALWLMSACAIVVSACLLQVLYWRHMLSRHHIPTSSGSARGST